MTQIHKQNVPKLRFPEFQKNENNGLRNILFADLFSFSSGKNIKQDEASPEFETPCVRYGELYHLYGEVIKTVINRTNIPSSELRFSDGDEILLPSAGEDPLDIGSASALTLEGVAIGRTINVLKPLRENEYLPVFASYYINASLKKRISCLARGSSISNVYNSDLKTLKINLPTLPEQRKIADFLGAVDDKIAYLSRKRSLLEDYKKGCMQQLFSQKIRFKDDDGNDFPDWEDKRLGGVFSEIGEKVGDRNLPTFSISAGKGWVSQQEKFGRDISGQQNERYTVLQVGDFSYNKGNSKSYKYGCVYPNNTGEVIAVPNVFISFRPISADTSVGFYAKLFENHFLDRGLGQLISSGARMDGLLNVNKVEFFKLKVPVPHPAEQRKIADFLSALDRKIDLVAQELTFARSFKAGLLQQMFV